MAIITSVIERLNRKMLGANSLKHPNRFTARGVSEGRWRQSQIEHELNYWVHVYPREVPQGIALDEYYRQHYWNVNRNMFRTIGDAFEGATIVDVGCGPFGSMDYSGAASVIGIDPLAHEYQRHYAPNDDLLILNAPAECMPLLDESADCVLSVNALDHMHRPYEALYEMFRVCKRGGHFLLATDVGGTPQHPCNIQRGDLDKFFDSKQFDVIEHDCGTHISSGWPAAMQIPLYVFHGVKR